MQRRIPGIFLMIVLGIGLGGCATCGDDDDDDAAADDTLADDDTGMDDDSLAGDDTTFDDDTLADDDTAADDDTVFDLGALIPGPGESGFDEETQSKAFRYAQQQKGMSAFPFGMSLDVYLNDDEARSLVTDWLTISELDQGFEEYTGVPVYDAVAFFGEVGDLGMFGGVASAGNLLRYALARDTGADMGGESLDDLRQNVIDLLEALHICFAITGVPGTIVRGICPRDMPGCDAVTTTPLFDDDGNPLPANKVGAWREDNSGLYPDWIWMDDTSKDQLLGYMFEIAVMWDVIAEDDEIDAALKSRLQDDAASIGDMLMEVAPETGLDLCIRDADGRLVGAYDLNPLLIEDITLPPIVGNGFNAVASLGIFKTIALVTGEQRFKDFFRQMIDERKFLTYINQTFKITNTGPFSTNWSNVNMAYTAIYPLLRFEADPGLRDFWQVTAQRDLWEGWFPGWSVAATKLAFFSVISGAFSPGPTDDEAADAAAFDLREFREAPYYDIPIENCDASEIAAGACLAVDGATQLELSGIHFGGAFYPITGHNGTLQANAPVPRAIRPPSDFDWRSSPYDVNGGGSMGLMPGGDFHAAYWLGRYLRRGTDSSINTSPLAW
jgi:hypothetical protein